MANGEGGSTFTIEEYERILEIERERNQIEQQRREIIKDISKFENDINDRRQENIDAQSRNEREMNVILKLEKEKILRQENISIQRDEILLLERKIAENETLTKQEQARLIALKAHKKISDSTPSIATALFQGDKGGSSLISSISRIGNSLEANLSQNLKQIYQSDLSFEKLKLEFLKGAARGGFKGAVIGVAKEAAKQFSKVFAAAAMLALAKYSMEAIRLNTRLLDQEAAFMKATGANREYARGLSVSFAETRKFAASVEETSQAFQSLFKNYTDFTFLNRQTQREIRNTTTLMSRLGVSSDDTAKSMMALTRNMGMGPEGAAQSMLNLTKFAEELQVPISQVTADFAAQSGALAKLGDEGFRSFMRLEIAAKASGLRVERLMAIVSKFDTFEGAAESAGKLNAALGGNFVNAMDLMMATDPVDRFNQIRDALTNAGLSFDTMGYYQRQFIAQSAGLQDAGELALVMKGRYDLLSDSLTMTTADYEEQADRAKEMATFQERLNVLFAQMIPILTPVIDGFSKLITFLTDNAQMTKRLVGGLTMLAGILGLVVSIITGNFVTGAGSLAGITLGFSMMADSIETTSESVSVLGRMFQDIVPIIEYTYSIFSDLFNMNYKLLSGVINQFQTLVNQLFGTNLNFQLSDLFVYFIKFGLLPMIAGLKILHGILGLAAAQLALMTGNLDKAIEIFNELGHTLFRKPFASSFLDGLIKIGNAFAYMAEKMLSVISNVSPLLKGFNTLGGGFKSILSYVAAPFATGTGSMAGASATAATNAVRANATTQQQAMAADNGGEMTVNQPVEIRLNGDVLEKFIVSVVGSNIRNIRVTQR